MWRAMFFSLFYASQNGFLNSSAAMRIIYGLGTGLFILGMNTPSILSVTAGYAAFHLVIIALGIFSFSLSTFGLFATKLIDSTICSRLFAAQTIGIAAGLFSIIPLALLSGLAEYSAYFVQLLALLALCPFFSMYDLSFSKIFDQLAEAGMREHSRWGPNLLSPSRFSRILLSTNIYAVLPVIVLLVSSQFTVVSVVVAFLAVSTLIGLELHHLAIRWSQPRGAVDSPDNVRLLD